MTAPTSGRARLRAALLAFAIGAGTALLVNFGFALAFGGGFVGGLPVFLFQAGMAAFPFLVLALAGIFERRPWRVALALTAAFWAYYLLATIRGARSGLQSGPEVGLALFMLATPFLITVAALAAHRLGRGEAGG